MKQRNNGIEWIPFYEKAASRIEWSDKYNDWKYTDSFMIVAGSRIKCKGCHPVGHVNDSGYRILNVSINKTPNNLRLHRVVFFKEYGFIPKEDIDHIDGDVLNNDIDNLREICHADNMRNRKISKNNKSGYTGVSWREEYGKWRTNWKCGEGRQRQKNFKKKEDAITHRKKMITEMGGYTERHGL